jgi:nitrile hydratase subunit alpha
MGRRWACRSFGPPGSDLSLVKLAAKIEVAASAEDCLMSGDHHHHDHDDHSHLTPIEARVKALESILVAKGLVDAAALDAIIDAYETKIGPRNGARVVAKAWADQAYAARLKADATAAIAELGYTGRQGEHMVAVFNDADTHHMVVCTLCSCYPWSVLGLPPVWYKSAPYRSRAVIDPRGVLAEFGGASRDGEAARLGFDRRDALSRHPGAACRNRRLE